MNILSKEQKIQAINALCQGMSLRAVTRLVGVHRTTVMKLMVRVGQHCEDLMVQHMKSLDCQRLEVDEIWSFCGKKRLHLTPEERLNPNVGDQYIFYAIDPITKIIPAFLIGKRTRENAFEFMVRLKSSLNGCRPQISTDDFNSYPDAISSVFRSNVDYGQITKKYGQEDSGRGRYSPPCVIGTKKEVISGNPNRRHICTSIIERSNLTIRTLQNRFTRLSIGFSRKLDNMKASVAIHFAYYNFCWIHRTIGTTPAVRHGLTDKVWSIADLIGDC